MTDRIGDLDEACAEFALCAPPGTPVRYFPVLPLGNELPTGRYFNTHVRSTPWISGGQVVVKIEDKADGVAITHLEIIK